jgi:hypothetical protein
VLSLAACLGFRRLVLIENPLLGCVACGIVVLITTPLVLALMPAGRKALADIKSSITLLRPDKASAV